LLAEVREYLEAGSIYGLDAAAAAGGSTWAANPTLLEPHTQRWKLHYSASPFHAFIPLDPAKHGGIYDASEPRALTQVWWADQQQARWIERKLDGKHNNQLLLPSSTSLSSAGCCYW
jgi:hypothetical protein